jgi:hypothetical protein
VNNSVNETGSDDWNITATFVADMLNTTAGAILEATASHIATARAEWTGLGVEWLRSLLGKREWRIGCLDVYIRL